MEKKVRKVVLSPALDEDLADIYDYGLDTFGANLAELFIANIYQHIHELPLLFLIYPECNHLETKTRFTGILFLENTLLYKGLKRIKSKFSELCTEAEAQKYLKQLKRSN